MGRPGRKRKAGKREPNGRLQRYPNPIYDKGSDWVQARRELFGEHYSTALGRAFAAGLLGDGIEAKARYDAGKRFARLYRRIIGGDAYRCPLNDSPRGNVVDLHGDRDADDQRWLFTAMDSMDVAGVRPYFDALISTANTDSGPYWLNNLLNGGRHPADLMLMKAAIHALDIISPETRRPGIFVSIST